MLSTCDIYIDMDTILTGKFSKTPWTIWEPDTFAHHHNIPCTEDSAQDYLAFEALHGNLFDLTFCAEVGRGDCTELAIGTAANVLSARPPLQLALRLSDIANWCY